MARYWQVLRHNPGFTRLWLSQVISLTGDWFNTIVLSTLVAQFSGGSGVAVSLFLLARFLPSFLFSPIAGVLVDRYNRKQVLIWSNLLRALIVPLFLFANAPDRLWIIYLVTVIQFVLSTVFEPGQSAIIPSLTRKEDLVEANTLVSVTWSVMLALGAVAGGGFAAVFGAQAALITDALTFAVAAGILATIRYTPRTTQDHTAQNAPETDTSFMEGIRYVLRSPRMAAALSIKTTSHIGNLDTLMTIFATQIFVLTSGGELSLGIMYSVFGVGAFVGPMLTNRFNDGSVPRMRRLVIIGYLAVVVGWVVLGNAWAFAIVCIAIFIRAVGGSINWTYSTIIIQKTAPDAYLGRMFSIDMAGFQLATVVSTLAHGWLVDAVGASHISWIAIGTGFVSLLPLLAWLWIVPRLEKYEAKEKKLPGETSPALSGDSIK